MGDEVNFLQADKHEGDSGQKKPKKVFQMLLRFSERRKSFSSSFFTQKFYI